MTAMTPRIVPIAEKHIYGFWTVLDSVAKEQRYLAMIEAPPLHEVRKFVLGGINGGTTQYVALAGDEVVGWCDVIPNSKATLRHSGALGMGIIDPFRGRGIGALLLDATLKAAKAKGLTRIELFVRVDNARAKKLYEKSGFVVEGLCKHHMCLQGIHTDSYLMALVHETA